MVSFFFSKCSRISKWFKTCSGPRPSRSNLTNFFILLTNGVFKQITLFSAETIKNYNSFIIKFKLLLVKLLPFWTVTIPSFGDSSKKMRRIFVLVFEKLQKFFEFIDIIISPISPSSPDRNNWQRFFSDVTETTGYAIVDRFSPMVWKFLWKISILISKNRASV